MTKPATDHPITIEPQGGRVVVRAGQVIIADSTNALRLRESTYTPVIYIPRHDVRTDLLTRTDHTTHCPYKGDASYFSIEAEGQPLQNAVWTYQAPIAAPSPRSGIISPSTATK
ncbi:MAG: DUF427 domain-containing protein [Pseudomonadota bacterium]